MNWFRRLMAAAALRAVKYAGVHPRDPLLAQWWVGNDTDSGVSVTEDTALQYPAFYAGVRKVAGTIGALPLVTYRRLPKGRDRAKLHPAYRLLHDAPNPEQTPFAFKSSLQASALIYGNGYAEIERDQAGRVLALWPLTAPRVSMERDDKLNLRYVVDVDEGEPRWLEQSDVLHIPSLSVDGRSGLGALDLFRQAIGLGLAAEQHGAGYYGRGARPDGVLTHPGELGDEGVKRLRESWDDKHRGLKRAHRIAILEEGMSYTPISHTPEEAQALETRRFQVTEAARILDLPPHLIGDLEHATFSNIEHMSIEFVVYSLLPWRTVWQQETGRKLFTEEEQPWYYTEFLTDALLTGDTESRYSAYSRALTDGWLSVNEVREMENRNPVPSGDDYRMPVNQAVVTGAEDIPLETPGADEVIAATGDDVQQTALDSAQVQSLLQITQSVSTGQMPPESAKALIAAAFPLMTTAQIDAIMNPFATFTPEDSNAARE